ncbi:MAG: hypothetical protein ABFS46_03470 [Myxococcota bacterium]
MGERRCTRWISGALAASLLLLAATASADEYDVERAGHPLRIVAYIAYPVGFAIDFLIMRPAHWVVSHEPWDEIFGHEED